MTYSDIYKLVEDEANKIVSIIISVLIASLIAFFRKMPRTIIQRLRAKKHLEGIKRGSKINVILAELGNSAGTIYVHIIRYHNGGGNRMSIDWETTGRVCDNCVTSCRNHNDINRLQMAWQNIPLSNVWHNVVEETVRLNGDINTINYADLDEIHQSIWNDVKIHLYKEALIKHKGYGFYTLGLSFCIRFKDYEEADGIMHLAARRLQKLL